MKMLKPNGTPLVKNLMSSPIELGTLIDEIPIGILILSPDRKIVLINRSLEALTGFTREESKGIACYQILRSKVCIKNCPVLAMTPDSKATCAESDIITKDRQLIPVRVNVSPILDQHGKLTGFIESVEDLRAIKDLNAKINQAFNYSMLVGKSPQMEKIFQILPMLAQSDSSVLITGETGTGKDLVAEAIHQSSSRSKGPFVKVNCGALPENLLESELFGHQKGAFTGATENKPGRFRLAHNGTLFLTEIGDLPLALQVKLLTFLDDQVIYPLGSTKGFQANVRVIGGTHRNLEQMVKDRLFREDLLFRLNVVRVQLPPLRERENDLRLLMDHFLNTLMKRFQKNISGFSRDVLQLLNNYPFPGNVRELRNIIEYAINICQESRIETDHLPAYLFEASANPGIQTDTEAPPPAGERQIPVTKTNPNQTWPEVERQMILDAMLKTGGRKTETAEMLGWGRSTLWRKLKKYNLI